MLNRCSPKKTVNQKPESISFIRGSSPDKLRQTFISSSLVEMPSISILRSTLSMKSLKIYDEIEKIQEIERESRQETFENLKNSLKEISEKIKKANKHLVRRNFKKKKTEHLTEFIYDEQNSSSENEEIQYKNRESISTALSKHSNVPIQKISQIITSQPKPENYKPFDSNPYGSKFHNNYYISEAMRALNEQNSFVIEHIDISIKMIQSCNEYLDEGLVPKTFKGFEMKRLERDYGKKKTLVLDLDETLIHCYEDEEVETDIKLTIDIEDTKCRVGVNIRPYMMTFLKRMAKKFEIVIFTASHETYANAILDEIDPEGVLISHRFYRNHCTVLPNELHVKNLRHLNRDLKDVVLVDNAAYSYAFQLNNGIPILPYYEGKDYELTALEKYLEQLIDCDDVREFNKNYFRLGEYLEFETAEEVIKKLYLQNN